MQTYKSFYPTLRQAKTKWSKPSIVQKQGEGPSHDWYQMMRKDARAKLVASIIQSRTGKLKPHGVFETTGEQPIYHVTHTKHVAKIQKHGILPMQTSNWVKAGDKDRYGGGEVYAFTHKDDAHAWAGRMDWAHNKTLGSGKISIITAHRPKDHEFEVDTNDPLSQAGKKGDWLKTRGHIAPHHIVSVEKYMPKKLGEDKIGKPTPSAEAIAKKHGITVDQVNSQIRKGIEVEKEHTNSDDEAAEIARDHLHEFPDYYDRLGKMETSAKKAVKEDAGLAAQAMQAGAAFVAAAATGAVFGPTAAYVKNKIKARKLLKGKPKEKAVKEGVKVNFTKASYAAANRRSSPEGRLLKKVLRNRPVQELPSKTPHPVTLKGFMRTKDGSFNVLKKIKEGYDPDKEIIKSRIETHKGLVQKYAAKYGEKSQEAAFHRALVKRMEKELVGEDTNLKEDAVPNSVGGGNIAGMPTHSTPEQTPVRRKRFAGKQVFVVDPTTFHNAYLGKRKYEHYEKYLEGCDIADEIREYGRKNWAEPIIIENEMTGAMVYLKYGSK